MIAGRGARRASLAALAMALAACASSSTPPGGIPTPAAPAPTLSPGAASPVPLAACRRADVEVALLTTEGAAGSILLAWGVRDTSAQPCTLTGYFGAARVDSGGHVVVTAERSTSAGMFGTVPPPHTVTLAPGTAALKPGPQGQGEAYAPVAGHAYFDIAYGDACNGGSPGAATAWQFIPPDDTGTLVIPDAGESAAVCTPEVTPVNEQPRPQFP
ncbi:MAG: hypothetical protein QOE95_1986 [Gaiellaceae bacterium]|nr:hypothetical protein [Gaiellaceae bacterium]